MTKGLHTMLLRSTEKHSILSFSLILSSFSLHSLSILSPFSLSLFHSFSLPPPHTQSILWSCAKDWLSVTFRVCECMCMTLCVTLCVCLCRSTQIKMVDSGQVGDQNCLFYFSFRAYSESLLPSQIAIAIFKRERDFNLTSFFRYYTCQMASSLIAKLSIRSYDIPISSRILTPTRHLAISPSRHLIILQFHHPNITYMHQFNR